jgi:hypothetical protein
VGRHIKLFRGWHHAVNAYVADFTCALLHYPFTSSFYNKVKDAAATGRYGHVTSDEYRKYWSRLSEEPDLKLCVVTGKRYNGIEALLDERFLVASADYTDYVRAQMRSLRISSPLEAGACLVGFSTGATDSALSP